MNGDKFFISVARERGGRAGEPDATITVEVSGGQALATELSMRASKGGGLDRASLPVIDALMQALSADDTPAPPEKRASREPRVRAAAAEPADREVATVPAALNRTRASRPKATSGARGRRPAVASDGGRAYRRMPEPAEVLAAYSEVGTINGLADHFGVPQHTVKGWARRLRQMGYELASKA